MSNVAIRPVQLKNGQQPFRPIKMPAWAPPGQQSLFDVKRMGQKKLSGNFSAEAIPTSLAVAVAGAGAIVGGMKLPSPWNTILIGGGMAALGYSIYNLFSGDPGKTGGVKEASAGSRITSPEVFNAVTGKFLSPKMYEETSYWTNAAVNLVLSNPSSSDAEFILIVHQYEMERSWFNSNPNQTKFNYIGKIMETPVTVKAGGNEPVKFEVDSDTVWPTAIKLVAEKIRIAVENPVKLSEVTFFG